MNLNKIKESILNLINHKKKRRKHNKKFIKKIDSRKFIKKRKTLCLKNKHIQKCKILGNNIISYYIALFIFFIILISYIVVGPIFKIKNIDIIKQDDITNMNIAYKAIENYRSKSIFYIKESDILKNLKDYQNNINQIETNIILPNTLKIIIKSYKGIFNTTINSKTFIITKNGTLIPAKYSKELIDLKIIYNFNKNIFLDYKKTINTEHIDKINNTIKSLEENILNLKISNISYYLIERELHIKINDATTVIFNLSGDIEAQIKKIAIFNKDFLDINKTDLIYIDLRIRNKIFYCTNENEYQCNKNIKKIYFREE